MLHKLYDLPEKKQELVDKFMGGRVPEFYNSLSLQDFKTLYKYYTDTKKQQKLKRDRESGDKGNNPNITTYLRSKPWQFMKKCTRKLLGI